ncbi:MAG: diacylglycerol/lipid kinase family protein [Gemmatimonadaceae bacterium]
MSLFFIVNPVAGRGRSKRLVSEFEGHLPPTAHSDVAFTECAGDEERLTERALHAGAQTIVAVGGDGTVSAIAASLLRRKSTASLAVVPCGTGNDIAKTLGVNRWTPRQIAELVERWSPIQIDVGVADGHFFLNSCGFGFDASVLEASNHVRLLKGDAVYIYSALRQLFTYRGVEVSVSGASGVKNGSMLMVTVSNGRWLGGAFKIAPQASVLDGKLDACFLGDSNVVQRVRLFLGAMRGTHIGMTSVSAVGVDKLTLGFPASPLMEVDGELRQAKSRTVNVNCVPRALSVVAAPGALV